MDEEICRPAMKRGTNIPSRRLGYARWTQYQNKMTLMKAGPQITWSFSSRKSHFPNSDTSHPTSKMEDS
jgi:hypothetical protein